MVLKGLAIAGALAAVTLAIVVVLSLRPATLADSVQSTAPAGNLVSLPRGVAAPALQPASSPILRDEAAPATLLAPASESFASNAAKPATRAAATESSNAFSMGCSGE